MNRESQPFVKKAYISDSSGNTINPAKEDGNLAAIKTAIESMDVYSGSINGLTEAIQEFMSRLSFLEGIRGTAGDLRVTPLSLPTLGTVTGQTNIGGYVASQQVEATGNINAVLSNIRNVRVALNTWGDLV